MRIIVGHDRFVASWVAEHIPNVGTADDFGPSAALGVMSEDGDGMLGGVVFHNWLPKYRSIEASFASSGKRWLTRNVIGGLLSYPFTQLQCERLTACTPRRAASARKFLDAFGFTIEGTIRKGFGDDDCVVSGLLREEWETSRFNPRRSLDGQVHASGSYAG